MIAFRDAPEFEAWLDEHLDQAAGVWLKLAKKGSGIPSLTDDEAVDVGLCYGWISGQRKGLDDEFYLQKYVPRRPRSRWSQVNVRKVEALTAAGRMRPSGQAEVDAAKADGRWEAAYVSQRPSRRISKPHSQLIHPRLRPSSGSPGPSSTPSSSTSSPAARPGGQVGWPRPWLP